MHLLFPVFVLSFLIFVSTGWLPISKTCFCFSVTSCLNVQCAVWGSVISCVLCLHLSAWIPCPGSELGLGCLGPSIVSLDQPLQFGAGEDKKKWWSSPPVEIPYSLTVSWGEKKPVIFATTIQSRASILLSSQCQGSGLFFKCYKLLIFLPQFSFSINFSLT